MEPLDYLRALKRRWALIAGLVGLAAAIVFVTTPSGDEGPVVAPSTTYTATATLLNRPDATTPLAYTTLFVSVGEIPERAAERLGYDGDPAVLASQVQAITDDAVGALKITVTNEDGEYAARVANVFAEEVIAAQVRREQADAQSRTATLEAELASLRESIESLPADGADPFVDAQRDAQLDRYASVYAQLEEVRSNVPAADMDLLQEATPIPVVLGGGFSAPTDRGPRVLIAALATLALAVVLVLVLERLDVRVRDRSSVQRALGAPVVAEVPRDGRWWRRRRGLASLVEPGGHVAEAFRGLRSALVLLPAAAPLRRAAIEALPEAVQPGRRAAAPQVVLVVSARSGEGKSTTVANLAVALAETGKSVLVLDWDRRKPESHALLDVPAGPGLSELLVSPDHHPLGSLARPTKVPGVRLVTSGLGADSGTAALPSRIEEIVGEARGMADVVLVDTSPVLVSNDAIDLVQHVDTTLVVTRAGRTTREQAERVGELLARLGVPVTGAVLFTGQRPPMSPLVGSSSGAPLPARRARSLAASPSSSRESTRTTEEQQ